MILEFVLLIIALALGFYFISNRRPKNYPPGPRRYPIIGNLLSFVGSDEKGGLSGIFTELSQKYGKVFSVDFGSYPAVILNDYKIIKEAWNNPAFAGTPHFHGSGQRTGGKLRGILFNDGETWFEQRRFALRHLRDFGFGKRSMETLVLDEISELIESFRKEAGQPISTHTAFNAAVLNALWTIGAGERFDHNDPKFHELVQNVQNARNQGRNPFLFFPWMIKLAPGLTGFKKFSAAAPLTYNYIHGVTRDIIKDYEGGSPQNFAHVFIDEMRKTTDTNSSFYGKEGEQTLAAVLMDLFQAGSETTSTALSWFLLYMSLFPELQKKLHEEIDEVLGKKQPSLADRPNMPFTEAVFLETLRHSSMVPTTAFHRTTEDVTVANYFIPKDTIVIASLQACHHDPQLWKEPQEFSPKRFLSPDGKTVNRQTEGFMAFSMGKKVCIGETLAKNELFLFVTSIFQNFSVTWDPQGPKPDLRRGPGAIIAPMSHMVVLTERNN